MFRSMTFFLHVITKPLKAATLYSHCSFIMLNIFCGSNMVLVRRFEITLTYSMYDFKVLNSVIFFFQRCSITRKVFSLLENIFL